MITDATPIAHQADLPKQADVVVIGGGIIGVSAAWDLAKDGHSVVLLEKGRVAGEQSSRNWGWVRVQGRDLAEIPIMMDAQAMWPRIAKEAGGIGLRQTGTLYLADTTAKLERYQRWLDLAALYQPSSRLISGGAVAGMMPSATRRWQGGLFTPTDFRAEPWIAVPRMAQAAARAGVVIRENCAVRVLDVQAGRVVGVITEAGRIKTQSVVLAGGAWSAMLLRRHGVSLPQLSVRSSVAQTSPMDRVYDGCASASGLAWRRRTDGGYTLAGGGAHDLFLGPDAIRAAPQFLRQLANDPLGTRFLPASPPGFPDAWRRPGRWSGDGLSPFERQRILNPAPNARQLRKLAQRFSTLFPSLGPTRFETTWAGMIDVMPDVVPVVDHVAAIPGLTLCTGMSGHGFGIGPAMGRIAARLATARDPGHDLTRFRLSRFTDGSRLDLGPAL